MSLLTHVQTGLCVVLLVWSFAGQIAAMVRFGIQNRKGVASKILSGKTGSKLLAVHVGFETRVFLRSIWQQVWVGVCITASLACTRSELIDADL